MVTFHCAQIMFAQIRLYYLVLFTTIPNGPEIPDSGLQGTMIVINFLFYDPLAELLYLIVNPKILKVCLGLFQDVDPEQTKRTILMCSYFTADSSFRRVQAIIAIG